jgi:hypothetical protein
MRTAEDRFRGAHLSGFADGASNIREKTGQRSALKIDSNGGERV